MKLLTYPNPILNETSMVVFQEELAEIKASIEPMTAVMDQYRGVGLAAIQVGIKKRYAIMDGRKAEYYNAEDPRIIVMINPDIKFCDIDLENWERKEEGCLSLPLFKEYLDVPKKITITYRDLDWNEQTKEFTGLLAQCVLHEMGHMNGHLLFDKVSVTKQQMWLKKLKKKGIVI